MFGKSADVQQFGFEKFFDPLIQDLKYLEEMYIEALDQFVRGKAFSVCPDNLGAHGLACFQESFRDLSSVEMTYPLPYPLLNPQVFS